MKRYSNKRKNKGSKRHGFNDDGILSFCRAKFGKAYKRWKHRNVEK